MKLTHNYIILAFLVLILGNLFATFVDIAVKVFASSGSIFQYVLLRQGIMLLLLLPFWLKLPTERRQAVAPKVYFTRALLTNIGAPTAVIAVLYLPLATANVFFYSAPLFTLLLANLLLKEAMPKHRIMVTLAGFAGVIIALKPEHFNLIGLVATVTALAVAGYNLSVRWLPPDTSTLSTLVWSNIFTIPITGCIAIFYWQPITQDILLLALISCLFLGVYQACCIIAYQKAEAGAIVVAEYSGLIFAALFGWLLFDEAIDMWTIVGILLIIFPIGWQSWYERSRRQ
ncbi:DMT family transporter [Aliikangiella maris]|uniref:DMT family transporter n=2 Tax=Aliikangiella maris TaxID=3162458 RepID=A0ABV3MPD2_9GAMM